MNIKKADYSKIASSYDKGRSLSGQIIDRWLEAVARRAGKGKGARLLDLGCGTGRFAIPIAEKLGYRVTGADLSQEMLDKAREKDTANLIKWEKQDAQALTYSDSLFDIVFISQVLHHCISPLQVLGQCYRVLKPGGVLLIRGCVIEEIRGDPESTFFPETRPINEARIFSLAQTKTLLIQAGFINIVSEMFIQRSSESGYVLYEKMANKNVSALTMIPQDAFECGLKKLHDYVQKNPDDPWLLDDKIRITAGYKRDKQPRLRYSITV